MDAVTADIWGGDAQWVTRDSRKVFCMVPEKRGCQRYVFCLNQEHGVLCLLLHGVLPFLFRPLKVLTLNVCLVWSVSVISELVIRL